MKNMYLFIALLGLICVAGAPSAFAAPLEQRIAMIINEDVILDSEVNDRMKLVIASSGLPNTDDVRARVRPGVINVLVDEEIKLQEARRLELDVTDEEITRGIESIAAQNNLNAGQFVKMLGSRGIPAGTFRDQVRAQIAWTKIVQTQLRPQIDISDAEIDDVLARIKDNLGATEYRVGEIFLEVDEDGKNEKDVRTLANRLANELKGNQKLSFAQVARQFSQGSSAASGGDLGWVQAGQLSVELENALQELELGAVSQPVKSTNGYHILKLEDTRQISEETLPAREEVSNMLGQQRLLRLARRYLQDLKTNAYVENRA